MTQSIAALKASNGVGAATTATVQNLRSSGATSIIVDTVSDWPTKFYGCMGTPHTFVDPITSETITVISEATAVDFVGHIDTGHIEIDAIGPGYVDGGSAVGDIVVVRPTTDWADNLAAVLAATHDDDGTLKDDIVVNDNIANNAVDTLQLKNAGVTPDKYSDSSRNATVATSEATTSTSYADLTTTTDTVTVTVGANGKLEVSISAWMQCSLASGNSAQVSFALSGANTLAAADARALIYQTWTNSAFGRFGETYQLSGLTPGSTVVKMKYMTTAGTGTFKDRHIVATPK